MSLNSKPRTSKRLGARGQGVFGGGPSIIKKDTSEEAKTEETIKSSSEKTAVQAMPTEIKKAKPVKEEVATKIKEKAENETNKYEVVTMRLDSDTLNELDLYLLEMKMKHKIKMSRTYAISSLISALVNNRPSLEGCISKEDINRFLENKLR